MANNIAVLDGAGASQTVKTTDTAGVHTPHHNVDSSALPTGAATSANQTTIIGHVDGIEGLLGTIDTDTGAIATSAASIDGKVTACNTGAVVVSSSALPTGAATAAKQPALGTAGTASADVISVQGIASMTALKVDGSAVTQPVSAASLPLPTGASTSANQTTIIGHLDGLEGLLTTIDADTGSLAGCVGGTEVQVDIVGALPAGTNAIGKLAANAGVTIGAVELAAAQTLATVTTVSTVTTCATLTGGGIAHDSADSGNPHKIGAKAETALSGLTLVADGDRTDLHAGVDGVLITRPHCNLEDVVTGNATNTDGTSTQCIAAQAAGIKTYLTSVIICNTSSSNITVDIKDGSTTKVSLPVPANSGCIFNPPVPVPGTAATAWNFDPSAAATTVTCSMVGFKSKV